MDIFFEQIVKINITPAKRILLCAIWLIDFLLVFIVVYLSFFFPSLLFIIFVLLLGIMYGGYKITRRFYLEYEYIATNNDLDVDVIVARTKRTRLITINLSEVLRAGAYNESEHTAKKYNKKYFCCNKANDLLTDDLFFIEYKHKTQGLVLMVLSPDERLSAAIKKALPRGI